MLNLSDSATMSDQKKTVVLGLGNPIMSDEGIGPAIIQQFVDKAEDYAHIEFVDVGTGGFSLLYHLEGVDKAKYVVRLLRDLEIPFLLIVDKDFIAPYLNSEFDSSLGNDGFPLYSEEFKNPEIMDVLVEDSADRSKILDCINSNYTTIMNILDNYPIFCMRYSLDLDLAAVASAFLNPKRSHLD